MEEQVVEVKQEEEKKETKPGVSQKTFFKNIVIVLISNIISMVAGVLIGFIIPKIMGVTEYGYYKTFTLYSSYIGILHFGFIDGIYLKFAGKRYEDLDKEKFRTYFKFLFGLELAASILVLGVSFIFFKTNYFWIILFVAINILATNITTYYELISQIMMKFKRTTARNIIRCSLNIVSVLTLYFLYRFNDVTIYNYYYVIITLSVNYLLAVWYMITYRDITFGKSKKIFEEKEAIGYFFKVGVPLLLSNLIGQIIYVVDQQFVNIAFDNDTYAVYAFAYNMINLITVATSAISTVLYPTLKRMNEETIKDNYSRINAYLLMFVAFCLIAYFPLFLIVTHFLPKYNGSLPTFLVILPGVLISSSISVIKYNCYKTFNKIINYFIKSVIMLAVAIGADFAVYYIFGNTISISIVSIAVLLVWYILVELYFIRAFKVHWVRNLLYILLILGGFYGLSTLHHYEKIHIALATSGYFLNFAIVTVLIYFGEIKRGITSLKEKKKNKQQPVEVTEEQ